MTEKQIEAVKEKLNKKYYGDNCRTIDNLKMEWTKKDEILEEELSCRSMINSMLVYGDDTEEGSYGYNRYLKPYTEKGTWHDGLITKKRLNKLIAEQKNDFEKATVKHNVYTDSEGCSYNSCHWADEQ